MLNNKRNFFMYSFIFLALFSTKNEYTFEIKFYSFVICQI